MLPDETLRRDMNQFTILNRWLLAVFVMFVTIGVCASLQYPDVARQLGPGNWQVLVRLSVAFALFLGLCPLAVTMALIWKAKEVILNGAFGIKHDG